MSLDVDEALDVDASSWALIYQYVLGRSPSAKPHNQQSAYRSLELNHVLIRNRMARDLWASIATTDRTGCCRAGGDNSITNQERACRGAALAFLTGAVHDSTVNCDVSGRRTHPSWYVSLEVVGVQNQSGQVSKLVQFSGDCASELIFREI